MFVVKHTARVLCWTKTSSKNTLLKKLPIAHFKNHNLPTISRGNISKSEILEINFMVFQGFDNL